MRREWVGNCLLVALSIAISLGVGEFALRTVFKPRALLTKQQLTGLGIGEAEQNWERDADLGWIIKPNARFRHTSPFGEFDTEIRTDADSVRIPLEFEPAASAERTILFVGDSVTAGYEVPYEETFVAKVEATLPQSRTINAAVRGYSSDQALKRMRLWLRTPNHEVTDVIYMFSHNDPFENMSMHFSGRVFSKPGAYLDGNGALQFRSLDRPVGIFDIESIFVEPGGTIGVLPVIGRSAPDRRVIENRLRYAQPRDILDRFYLVGLARLAADILFAPDAADVERRYPYLKIHYARSGDGGYAPTFADPIWSPESYPVRLLEEIIRTMKAEADSRGIRFWLGFNPTLPDGPLLLLREIARRQGVKLIDREDIDTVQAWERRCGGQLVFRTDGHFTACGHSAQAEPIIRALQPQP